jgi:hypothetical protein
VLEQIGDRLARIEGPPSAPRLGNALGEAPGSPVVLRADPMGDRELAAVANPLGRLDVTNGDMLLHLRMLAQPEQGIAAEAFVVDRLADALQAQIDLAYVGMAVAQGRDGRASQSCQELGLGPPVSLRRPSARPTASAACTAQCAASSDARGQPK